MLKVVVKTSTSPQLTKPLPPTSNRVVVVTNDMDTGSSFDTVVPTHPPLPYPMKKQETSNIRTNEGRYIVTAAMIVFYMSRAIVQFIQAVSPTFTGLGATRETVIMLANRRRAS